MTYERNAYSFVGTVACGRWAMVVRRKYLWGTNFYWLYDCSTIEEVLEYNGSIHHVLDFSYL